MRVLQRYVHGLSAEVGERWNRFWFELSDSFDLCVMRILVGAWALLWQLSYSVDLIRWFGPRGWFDAGVYDRWVTAESSLGFSGRLSFLFTPAPEFLWTAHVLSALVLLAFTLGIVTRVSAILSLIVVLAYVHRAPFICGATEVVLTMLVAYLCLAPCGDFLSLDARRRAAKLPSLSVWATIARRLLQVHVVAMYAIMAMSKLGAPTWWNGEAVWWLAGQPLSRDIDLTSLRQSPLLLNMWTYAVLITEFAFVLLVWNPWFRPLVLAASTACWISIGLAAGNFALPGTMILANLVFVPSWFWKDFVFYRRAAAAARGAS